MIQAARIPVRWDVIFIELGTFVIAMVGATWRIAGVLGKIEVRLGRMEERLRFMDRRVERLEAGIAPPSHS